jgi:hypothetical protein
MTATTAFAIGPVPTDVVTMGQPIAPMRTIGAISTFLVPFSTKMSASYTSGGDPLTLPTSPALIAGMKLQGVIIAPIKYGANIYTWNGSMSAPTIQAWTAFNTEAGAIDLSAVTISGYLIFVS